MQEVGLTCEEVYDSTYTLSGLLACTTYHVSVTSVTPSGFTSDKTWQSSDTLDLGKGRKILVLWLGIRGVRKVHHSKEKK